MRFAIVSFAALIMAVGSLSAEGEEITECDRLAAHPSDPERVSPGHGAEDVNTDLAIPACRAAVAEDPQNARLNYQLGRVLYYRAQAEGADTSEGVEYVQRAAELKHTQAMLVRGLLHKYDGESCAAERLTKAAADDGLKSARLTYVNDVLGGVYEDCALSASTAEMAGYLDAAASQVSGYYENMLLSALRRELGVRDLEASR